MLTRDDMRREVLETLHHDVSGIPDMEALLTELHGLTGEWTLGRLSPEAYWGVIQRHHALPTDPWPNAWPLGPDATPVRGV